MKNILFIVFIFLCTFKVKAQIFCGTKAQQFDNNTSELFHSLPNFKNSSTSVDSVAITFHVVLHEWNFENIPFEFFLNQLDLVNRYYFDAGIKFFMCGSPRYLQGSNNYNYAQWKELNKKNYVPNTINIYYVDGIQFDEFNYCGYANFPRDGSILKSIIIDKSDQCNIGGKLLAHELGHFYGLLHTHETFYGNELVDGSNCETTGDRLCDTPADPNLSNNDFVKDCMYTGDVQDTNGNHFSPMVENIMSYSPLDCQTTFTPNQLSLINFNHKYTNSIYLSSCDFYPDFKVSTDFSITKLQAGNTIAIPINFENLGMLDFYSVPLNFHLSEAEDDLGAIIFKDTILFHDSKSLLNEVINIDLPLNMNSQTYYMTVVIDSEFEFIEQNENNNEFKISLKIDNSNLKDEQIFPNPTNGRFKIFIRDPRLIQDYRLNIFNINGQVVKSKKGYKNEDELFIELDITDLTGRLFFVQMYFPRNNLNKSLKIFKYN